MLDGFAQHPDQYVGLTTKPGCPVKEVQSWQAIGKLWLWQQTTTLLTTTLLKSF